MSTRIIYDVSIEFWSLSTLLIHMLTCLGTNGFSIQIIPRHSVDSVLFPKNLSQKEKHNRIVKLSNARAFRFQSMDFANVINSTKQGIKELQPIVMIHPGYFYVAKIEIGTAPYSALLLVDNGSNETWVQGNGCDKCFPLSVGNFKYKQSRTYAAIPCDHPLCVPRIRHENLCVYDILYGGGNRTKGYLSSERFTFRTSNGRAISYANLIFGVGLYNQNIQFSEPMGEQNNVAGLFGLGSGTRSILRQLEFDTDLRFSNCLSDWSTGQNTFTYISFGKGAQIRGNDQAIVQTTPLLPDLNKYFVQVLGIMMNKEKLPIDPIDFQLTTDLNGGFFIDSGAAITYLVRNAYNVVRAEIVRYLQAYNWNPMAHSGLHYDLCYDVQPTENQLFPSLTINFLGANLELCSYRVFKLVDNNIYCMMINPTSQQGSSILGAFQQQDYRFLFDVGTGDMNFAPEKCQLN